MSNRLFQGIVHQMKDAIDRTIGVIDETSVVIACSELGKIGEVNENINSETLSLTAPFVINGYTYKSFGSSAKYDYAVFVQGTDEYAQKYRLQALALWISYSSELLPGARAPIHIFLHSPLVLRCREFR